MLREILSLSTSEKVQFFARWMAEEDAGLKVTLFTAWMRTERDRKLKKTLFVSWMKEESGDKKLLRDMADKGAAVYVTEGFTKWDYAKIEHWIEAAVDKEDGRTADQIAHTCKNHVGLPEKMMPLLKKVIRIKKENKRLRERKRRMSAEGGCRPRPGQPTAFKRLLTEDTYSVPMRLDEKEGLGRTRPIAQPTLPGALDGKASLDSKRRIEDYDAIITPYRACSLK
jgi:hypothetical protein